MFNLLRYNSTVELKDRMDPTLFLETMAALEDIRVSIEEYINYAERLTSEWDTSKYSLIEKSLKQFYANVMFHDFDYLLRYVMHDGL